MKYAMRIMACLNEPDGLLLKTLVRGLQSGPARAGW